QAAAAAAQAQLNIASAELAAAQRALAALWGGAQEMIDATGPWEFQSPGDVTNTAPTETLDYRLAEAEHQTAEAALRMERANSWVDLTLSAGQKRFEETGEEAWV